MKRLSGALLGLAVAATPLALCGCNKPAETAPAASPGAKASAAIVGGTPPPKVFATPASPALAHDIDAYKARQGIK